MSAIITHALGTESMAIAAPESCQILAAGWHDLKAVGSGSIRVEPVSRANLVPTGSPQRQPAAMVHIVPTVPLLLSPNSTGQKKPVQERDDRGEIG